MRAALSFRLLFCVLPFDFCLKKEWCRTPPWPGTDGHLRGLPQSFTRSQKERPLSEPIITRAPRPLVAIVLQGRDEFTTRDFYLTSVRRKQEGKNLSTRLTRNDTEGARMFERLSCSSSCRFVRGAWIKVSPAYAEPTLNKLHCCGAAL